MKLTAAMMERGACGAPHRRPDAWILSPLPNLLHDRAAAVAEIVHLARLEPMHGSALTGAVTLRLRGESLEVTVTADRQVHVDLRHCRSETSLEEGEELGDLLLVITACGGLRRGTVSSATFDLASRADLATLAEADLAQLPPGALTSLRPAAVLGVATRGWSGRIAGSNSPPLEPAAHSLAPARGGSDDPYLLRRIKEEIGAALRAAEPGVASRHVQLATLLARRLQQPGPAPVARRRFG